MISRLRVIGVGPALIRRLLGGRPPCSSSGRRESLLYGTCVEADSGCVRRWRTALRYHVTVLDYLAGIWHFVSANTLRSSIIRTIRNKRTCLCWIYLHKYQECQQTTPMDQVEPQSHPPSHAQDSLVAKRTAFEEPGAAPTSKRAKFSHDKSVSPHIKAPASTWIVPFPEKVC